MSIITCCQYTEMSCSVKLKYNVEEIITVNHFPPNVDFFAK